MRIGLAGYSSAVVAAATALLLGLCASGCGGGSEPAAGEGESSVATAGAGEPPSRMCKKASPSKARRAVYRAPPRTVSREDELTAVVRTSCGVFVIALEPKRFPETVNSFVFLARKGFYDGLRFDKAGAGRYLHGGDPPGRAQGPGYNVREEVPDGLIYRHRMVVMSEPGRRGYGHAGSQFFVVLAKPWLDFAGLYPPLGRVEKGLDVLEAISRLGPRSRFPNNPGVLGPVGELRRPVSIEEISIMGDK
jgi:cyclophilin family peptidyl-prolyl cis-trans isomerase